MIINAENQIAGRVAAYAAKKAIVGEEIIIINCEKAVITGSRPQVLAKFKRKRELGVPLQGPYYPRKPEMVFKRIIRGMLPYKKEKGESAFKRIKCYKGEPSGIKKDNNVKVLGADISKVPNLKYITIAEVSRFMGAKI